MINSVDELLTKLRDYDYHHHHFAAPILNVLDEATFYRIAVVDEHMHFLYLSINAAELVGLPQKAILGKRWSDFDVDQGVLQHLENLATQALQSGLPCQDTCRSPLNYSQKVFSSSCSLPIQKNTLM